MSKSYTDRKMDLLSKAMETLLLTGETDDDTIIRRAFYLANGILDKSREQWEEFEQSNGAHRRERRWTAGLSREEETPL